MGEKDDDEDDDQETDGDDDVDDECLVCLTGLLPKQPKPQLVQGRRP